MSAFDWTKVGDDLKNFFDGSDAKAFLEDANDFKGSLSVVYGDVLNSVIGGGEMTHIYGNYLQYTVDWEGLLQQGIGRLLSKSPAMESFLSNPLTRKFGAALMGANGYVNFVYGSNVGAVYGPNIFIHRGPAATVTGNNWLYGSHGGGNTIATFGNLSNIDPAQATEQADIDKVVQIIVIVLSIIMVLVGLILEILVSTVFKEPDLTDQLTSEISKITNPGTTSNPNPDHTDDTDQALNDISDAIGGTPPNDKVDFILQMVSYELSSRFMAFITVTEQVGQDARDAVYRVPSVQEQLDAAKTDLAQTDSGLLTVAMDLNRRLAAAEKSAKQGIKDVKAVISGVENVLTGQIAQAQQTADDAVPTASLSHLTVQDWSVAAAQDITMVSQGSNVMIQALGSSGQVMLDSKQLTSLRSGPTKLLMMNGFGVPPAVLLSGGASGSVTLMAGPMEIGSSLILSPEDTIYQVGDPLEGASIMMTEESIKLSVGGLEGASISITPASIVMKVGAAVKTITAASILEEVEDSSRELTPEGHNLTAGEVEHNIGVTGQTTEQPTVENETEASVTDNTVIRTIASDGLQDTDAGVQTDD